MPLIVLDRDGVINRDSDEFIKSIDEWIPLPGSLEAIARLHKHNYRIVVVTNQSGISRGYYNDEILNAMHDKFRHLLAPLGGKIDAIFYCPHGPDNNCHCRKPKAGLYENIMLLFPVDLTEVYTVGDSYRDLEAAMSVGSKPILVKTGKGDSTFAKNKKELTRLGIPVYRNLSDFVDRLLE